MLEFIGKENSFLNLITKILKSTNNIFFQEATKLLIAKDKVIWAKRQSADGKISVYVRGLVTTIYKGLKKGKYYSKNNPINKIVV